MTKDEALLARALQVVRTGSLMRCDDIQRSRRQEETEPNTEQLGFMATALRAGKVMELLEAGEVRLVPKRTPRMSNRIPGIGRRDATLDRLVKDEDWPGLYEELVSRIGEGDIP